METVEQLGSITSPGSMNNFRELHPELSEQQLATQYQERLIAYRDQLASMAHVSVAELHDGPLPSMAS